VLFRSELKKVVLDYFAQSDKGVVYSLGEEVNVYDDGQVVSREGTWLYGRDAQTLGVAMPATPAKGDTFSAVAAPGINVEHDEVLSVSDTVTVPAGTVADCVRVRATTLTGTGERSYAPAVGMIRDATGAVVLELKSHH
jgi:hypothetical protein